jgi:putative ATPase
LSLFEAAEKENRRSAQPLALRMRPRNLSEFVGQQHFLGEGKLLYRLIKADRLTALLFYGPPGTGKTTLAHLLASETRCRFRHPHAAVRRRNPSVQQIAARCAAA